MSKTMSSISSDPMTRCDQFLQTKKLVEETMAIMSGKVLKMVSKQPALRESQSKFKAEFGLRMELLFKICLSLDIQPKDLLDCDPIVVMSKRMIRSSRLFELKRSNRDKINELIELNEQMKVKTLEGRKLSETDLSQIKNKIVFYEQKGEQYRKQVKQHEADLKDSGLHVNLTEDSLRALRDNNRHLAQQLESVEERLKEFDFEPTNEALMAKIAEMSKLCDNYELEV